MSSEKLTTQRDSAIVQRFIEVCGSNKATPIKQLLNISYQAAKNYLNGRLPTTEILLKIADNTPYSIHWLLTGNGNKFAEEGAQGDRQVLTGEMRESFKEVIVEIFNEVRKEEKVARRKVVVLDNKKVKKEKTVELLPDSSRKK